MCLEWIMMTGDVTAAFLQGEELQREVYIRFPQMVCGNGLSRSLALGVGRTLFELARECSD